MTILVSLGCIKLYHQAIPNKLYTPTNGNLVSLGCNKLYHQAIPNKLYTPTNGNLVSLTIFTLVHVLDLGTNTTKVTLKNF